jgi:hypothetical protein
MKTLAFVTLVLFLTNVNAGSFLHPRSTNLGGTIRFNTPLEYITDDSQDLWDTVGRASLKSVLTGSGLYGLSIYCGFQGDLDVLKNIMRVSDYQSWSVEDSHEFSLIPFKRVINIEASVVKLKNEMGKTIELSCSTRSGLKISASTVDEMNKALLANGITAKISKNEVSSSNLKLKMSTALGQK